jgi:hypothetical protein
VTAEQQRALAERCETRVAEVFGNSPKVHCGDGLTFRVDSARELGADPRVVREILAREALRTPWVARAYT